MCLRGVHIHGSPFTVHAEGVKEFIFLEDQLEHESEVYDHPGVCVLTDSD